MKHSIPALTLLALLPSALMAETFSADVWADNWFEMRMNGEQVAEDSVPITTERSFNAESFTFDAERPFVIGLVAKDFKENDTGLEYIGTGRQQMGDGGVIVQIRDAERARRSPSAMPTGSAWSSIPRRWTNPAKVRRSRSRAKGPAPSRRWMNQTAGIRRALTPRTGRRQPSIPSARSAPRTAMTGSTGWRTPG